MREAFERSILRDEQSDVFREYCRRVHGVDRFQYNSLTSEHFEVVLRLLDLSPGDTFVDVGCATGSMTAEVARRTGTLAIGLDFAPALIERARQSAPADLDLSFSVGDLDDLRLAPASVDAIMAIDALYFASDLERTVGGLLDALRPRGRIVVAHSVFRKPGEGPLVLSPQHTDLARAISVRGVELEWIDLTAADREHWKRAIVVTEQLRTAWEAAGELDAWRSRCEENAEVAPMVEAARAARFLYVGRQN